MLLFADISSFTKEKKNISQYRIISVIQRTINIINCAKEGASLITKQGAVKKKYVFVSTSRPHKQNVWKLCLKICFRKWLKPNRSLVRYSIPLHLWQFKTLFGDGLINFNKFFLKTLRLAALRRVGSSLFRSITVDGKK